MSTKSIDAIVQRIEDLRQRALELQAGHAPPLAAGAAVLADALQELSTALEELQVAEEELLQQNDELQTARHLAEAEQQRYRDLFEFAPDGYLVTDLNGVIREANSAAGQLFSIAPQLLIGKPLIVFTHASDHSAFRAQLQRLLQADRLQGWNVTFWPRAGAEFHAELTVAVVRTAPGKAVALRWLVRDITERTRAAEQIERSRQQLEHAQRVAHLGSWEWDIPANVVTWSDELYRLYGLQPGETSITYAGFLARVHPDDREAVNQAVQRAYHTREPFRFEHRIVRPEGSIRALQAHGEVIVDERGEPIRMIGTGHDITARRQAEDEVRQLNAELEQRVIERTAQLEAANQALRAEIAEREQIEAERRESEERYRQLVDLSPDAIFIEEIDAGERLAFVNSAGARLLGAAAPGDLIGKPIWEFVHPDYHDRVRDRIQQLKHNPAAPSLEEKFVRLDGAVVDVEVSAARLTYRDKLAIQVIAHDITERKRTEEQLQLSQARFAGIIRLSDDAILSIDAEQRITLANPGVERIFGYRPEELLGQPLETLLPQRFAENHQRHIEHFAASVDATRPMHERGPILARRKAGEEFPAEASISKFEVGGEKVLTVRLRDITARVQAEDAIQRLNQDLNRRVSELQALFDILPVGICLAHDPELQRMTVNPAGARMLNISPEANPSKSAPGGEQLPFKVLKNGRELAPDELPMQYAAAHHTTLRDLELDVLHQDGARFSLLEYASPLYDEQRRVRGCLGVFVDITERKAAERRLDVQYTVTRALAESGSLDEAYRRALQAIGEGVGWEFGALWRVDHDMHVLRNQSLWRAPTLTNRVEAFEAATRTLLYSKHTGLPGQVWAEGRAKWAPDLRGTDQPRAQLAAQAGLHAAFAFPIYSGAEVIAVIECYSRQLEPPNADLLEMLEAIGSQIGNYIERRQAEDEIRIRARQQAAVAALGQRALAGIDLSELMDEAVAHVALTLAVGYVKVLELLPNGQTLRLRSGVGWQAGLVGQALVDADRGSQAGYTLLSGGPVIVEDLRAETRFTGAALLREHNVVSGLSVIIPGRERPFGVLGAHSPKRRTFTPDDTNFLQAVANVLAAAIERKRSEDELRLSRDQLAVILEGVADGITAQDATGRLVYANEAAARVSGYASPEALLDAPSESVEHSFEIFDEMGQPVALDQLPGSLALHGMIAPSQLRRYRATTGKERWLISKARPILNEHGQVELAVNIFQDVTPLKRAEQAQRLLAEAGQLLAAALDHETRLAQLAQLVVPVLADWCAINVRAEEGSIRQIAVAHSDPNKAALVAELRRRYPIAPELTAGVANVLRTGRSEVDESVTVERLALHAVDAEHLQLLRALGLRSKMDVPLIARGRTIGVITFVRGELGRPYTPDDLALAEELARRAALAVDNARLYQEAQQLNAELEQRVNRRTAQLQLSNRRLEAEIAERRRAQAELVETQRRLTEGREAERLQLAQELHDGPVQDLYGITYRLAGLKSDMKGEAGVANLSAAQIALQQVIHTLRTISGDLRPPTLTPFGLETAIRSHAEHFQEEHPELEIELDLASDQQALPERVRLALFRIYQQALINVARHAEAQQVAVRLDVDESTVRLEISDDGRGFEAPARWIDFARQGHLGLIGAAERAEAVGGEMKVSSTPGAGTRIQVSVPLGAEDGGAPGSNGALGLRGDER
ncbi:MAG TPA: PAS domain S-box protein [Anaerolineae bacterium]|nr:PAS domain S-box protein [Anaerolineae bacterium]